MSPVAALASATASAVLCGLAFPPWDLRALAWLGLAPFFAALHGRSALGALGLGWWWALLFAWSVGEWMPPSIATYYEQPAAVGWGFLIAIASSMVAPYIMLFAWMYARLTSRWGAALPLLGAAAWAGCELLRGRLFTGTPLFIGNPWALIGYSQVGWDEIVQIASVTGVYGIGFAVAAANGAVVALWQAQRRALGLRALSHASAGALAPVTALWIFGLQALGADEAETAPAVRVAIVQGNLPIGSRWRSDLYGANLETYLELTQRAIGEHRPQVVVWPESSMTFFLEREVHYRRSIARLLGSAGVELVAGGARAAGSDDAPRFLNAIFAIRPTGEIRDRYDKQYLVPFGEYFPLSSIGLLRRRFEGARLYAPGSGSGLLEVGRLGVAAVATCNEAMLPEVVGRRIAAGGEFILNPSNDSWIPDRGFAELQFQIVALRAVEQRRYLVRASTSGPSAIVDPWGRVQVRSAMGEQTTLSGSVHARNTRSLYSRAGDWFGFGCLVAGALASAFRPLRGGAAPGSTDR